MSLWYDVPMKLKKRRILVVLAALALAVVWVVVNPASYEEIFTLVENTGAEDGIPDEDILVPGGVNDSERLAVDVLEELEVKGRAPKKGYERSQFYEDWPLVDGCSLRQRIIRRELGDSAVLNGCSVIAGEYDEPYTGEHMVFTEKSQISAKIQIDHVVALSDAWQKGAQQLSAEDRYEMATDPLNLLAVDGETNKNKSDGDAATWLPPNKKFRCQYVARQVSVKFKYGLWVTQAEKEAILRILENCPNEAAIGV